MSELVRVIRRSSVAVIMSRKRYVLFEVEVVKNARKFVRCWSESVYMNVEVTSDDKFRR